MAREDCVRCVNGERLKHALGLNSAKDVRPARAKYTDSALVDAIRRWRSLRGFERNGDFATVSNYKRPSDWKAALGAVSGSFPQCEYAFLAVKVSAPINSWFPIEMINLPSVLNNIGEITINPDVIVNAVIHPD